jgi:hypothetical protein
MYINPLKYHKNTVNLEFLICILIIAWILTPIISTISFYRSYTMILLFIFWILLVHKNDKNFIFINIKTNFLLILFIVIIYFYTLLSRGSQTYQRIYQYIYLIILISFYLRYSKIKFYNFRRFIIFFILLSFGLTSIITNYVLMSDPLYAKLISTADSNLPNIGVGGFHFIYGLVALTISLVIKFRSIKQNRLLFFLLILLFSFTIFNTQYFTAIILFLFFLLLAFMSDFNIKAIFVFFLFFLLIVYFDVIPIIFNFIISFVYDAAIIGRINDILNLLSGNSLDDFSSLGNRLKDFYISLETFSINPLFGVGAYYGLDHLEYGIGNHSQWIDDLARYGIMFSSLLFIFLTKIFKSFFNKSVKKSYLRFGVIYFILLGLFNPVFGNELNGILFLFIPLISLEG